MEEVCFVSSVVGGGLAGRTILEVDTRIPAFFIAFNKSKKQKV